jgi:ankyrin repeat protein
MPLPQDPDLGHLRRQARDLQRAARRGDASALALIAEFSSGASTGPAPAEPVTSPAVRGTSPERIGEVRLADTQRVIARRYGFASWARLAHHVQVIGARSWHPDRPAPGGESLPDRFLRLACLTYDGEGGLRRTEAAGLLAAHPGLSRATLVTAAACADVEAVRAFLAADRSSAATVGGPYGWSPLLYQAYARHDPTIGESATLETARLLLDAGADANDGRFWHGLPTPFTVLTGVFGDGERAEPPHPQAIPFARLLLDRGADPNDGQALYNRMFSDNNDHLALLFEYGLGRTTSGPWHQMLGAQLDSPPTMLRNLLAWAIIHDQRDRVELLAGQGVDMRSPVAYGPGGHRAARPPAELALVNGHREMSHLLVSFGAAEPRLGPEDAFVAAAMSGDEQAVDEMPPETVARVRRGRPGLVVWAAAQGAPNAVELLARKDFDVDARGRGDLPVDTPWQTALHVAAERGDVALAQRLLGLGADPTLPDTRFGTTPAGWARHFGHADLARLLDESEKAVEAGPGRRPPGRPPETGRPG